MLLTPRPTVTDVQDPPEITIAVRDVQIDGVAARRYASMCGFDPAAGLPVTYPHVLATPLHLKIFSQQAFALRPMGLIHLSNVIESPGVLEPGRRMDVTVSACNYRNTDAGLVFDLATDIRAEGQSLWRETCVLMVRWPESPQRTGGRPPRPPKAPKDSQVLGEFDVSPSTAWAYARVSGDFNPIHLNDRAARFFGLRGAISHGMWSLARSLAQAPVPGHPARREDRDAVPHPGAAAGAGRDPGVAGGGPDETRPVRRPHRARSHVRVVVSRYSGLTYIASTTDFTPPTPLATSTARRLTLSPVTKPDRDTTPPLVSTLI